MSAAELGTISDRLDVLEACLVRLEGNFEILSGRVSSGGGCLDSREVRLRCLEMAVSVPGTFTVEARLTLAGELAAWVEGVSVPVGRGGGDG